MQEDFMNPNIIYVEVSAKFTDSGQLLPQSFVYKKEWPIDDVLEATIVTKEDYAKLFPNKVQPNRVYKYKVKVAGVIRHIYFELWPETGAKNVGRWFVSTSPGEAEK